jgi:hypothetical protein
MDSFSLDDDYDYTGHMIAKFSFRGTEQQVTSWTEMYQKVLQLLHQENRVVLRHLAVVTDPNVDLSAHVSTTRDIYNACQIDDNIYVLTNTSTQNKVSSLRKFFSAFGIDPTELVFFLREDMESEEPENSRSAMYNRYWQYALPKIRESSGTFTNINFSNETWVNGFLGIGGIHVDCIATSENARVELYIGTALADHNKKVFDFLNTHKQEIESAIDREIIWDRGDNKKTSRIFVIRKDLTILNESNWPDIAEFHAKYTGLLVPLCRALLEQFNHRP